jgi:hypothetical protein
LGMMIGWAVGCEVDVVLDVDVEVKVEVAVGREVVVRWRSEAVEETVARWAGRQAVLVTGLDCECVEGLGSGNSRVRV